MVISRLSNWNCTVKNMHDQQETKKNNDFFFFFVEFSQDFDNDFLKVALFPSV